MQVWKSTKGICFLLFVLSACSSQKGHDSSGISMASNKKKSVFIPNENPFVLSRPITSLNTWAEENKAQSLHLLFSANINGETDICGCALNPKGGLDRRLNFVRAQTERPMLAVDAGNALFPSANLDPTKKSVLLKKAIAVLEGHSKMGIKAQNVGHLDLGAGVEWLRAEAAKAKMPLVSASWVDFSGKLLFEPFLILTLENGMKVGVTGLSAGGASSSLADSVKARPPVEALHSVLKEIPSDILTIVFSDLGTDGGREVAESVFERPLLFIDSRDMSGLEIPLQMGSSLLIRPQLQGQQWGVIDIAWNAKSKGWFSPSLGERFRSSWEGFTKEREMYINNGDKESLRDFDANQGSRLLSFAPGDVSERSLYEVTLVEMSAKYAKKNELTPVVERLRKLK